MKITCQREKFLTALQTVAAVVPTRSTKNILQNVKLEIGDNFATLMATDLEVGIRYEVSNIQVERPGVVILPVARFGAILRESADEMIRMNANDRSIVIQGEHSEFNLQVTDPAEFPPIAIFEETQYVELSARLFRELIHRTIFATDNESSRYALGGILIDIENDHIAAVATDGRRLAKMEGPVTATDGYVPSEGVTIVPSRAMQLIERTISDSENEVRIACHANDILVKSQYATIYARLLEGRFPKWRDVFPKYSDAVRMDLLIRPFYAAVRQAAIVTTEESRGINFTFGSGALVLTGQSADVGQSRIEIPIPYDGAEVTIKLDPRFVSDFLRVLDLDKTFNMTWKDGENAVLCSTDDGYAYVIMPLARDR
ncbi:MAG: DNA polymerase III subunit beta [Pirellulales bacterium]|nr:DNA polymerase III subunit beta [Pirellulales bacterium]